jgi:AraC family transcriptional regulator, regulatory protein of adaptative response / methylated-DNA-[protein]-cysteine methyltransferase
MGRRTSDDYSRIARVIERLVEIPQRSDRLTDLAAEAGVSRFHLQRSFREWAGLTPKQFSCFVSVCRGKGLLRAAKSVLDVALEIGLSGPGRLHDHFLTAEAVTPGEFKSGGDGVQLGYGCGGTPFGPALIAWTHRGVCRLTFIADDSNAIQHLLRQEWPAATLERDDPAARALLGRAFASADVEAKPFRLVVRGTAFQIAVWRALMEIPEGQVSTYGRLAERAGFDGASRAVGRAVGDNPIAFLIPCHRVIRSTGLLGGYRWGIERKTAMLAGELRRCNSL